MSRVLLAVGDASGDLHAAELVRALRGLRPGLRFLGMGGPALAREGVELRVDQRALAVGGIVELAGSARRIVGAWRALGRALAEEPPDLVVLVDSGAFNLPFARRVARAQPSGRRIPVLYYVAPQVWAWRRGRLRKLARRVDRVAAILPFEPAAYEGSDVRVDYVGHPLVDPLRELAARLDREEACRALGLDPGRPWLALLPGSRRNELRRNWPLQLETVRQLHVREPRLGFAVAVAPSLGARDVDALCARLPLPSLCEVVPVVDRTRELLVASQVALLKPGTATLEASLLGCPMVVMGRAHPWTAFVVRRALQVPHLAMPNLIAGRRVVPELLQEEARPDRLADAVQALLGGPERDRQAADLAEVRERLGSGGAARRSAAIALELLDAG